jgi:hypothetical protein
VHLVARPNGDRSEAVLVLGAWKQRQEAIRSGARGEIPVLGFAPEDGVPDRSADDVGGVALRPQPVEERSNRVGDRDLYQLRPRNR